MEHKHRNAHLLGKQKNKKANQGTTPEEYKRRMAFYTKRYEDEQKEKDKQTNTPEDTPEQNINTVNTPVSKQNGVDTSDKINAKKTPTTQPKEEDSTSPEKIKQKEKELGVDEVSTTTKTEVTDKDKAPETEVKTDGTPKSNTTLQLPKDEEKTLSKDKADTTQGTDNSNTPQTNTTPPSTDIKSTPEKSPSGASAKTLPGGDKMGNKQGNEKKEGAGGGGDGKRTTLVPRMEFDGSEKDLAKRVDSEKGQPKAKMLKASEPALEKNKKKVAKTQKAEKKKTPVVKKLEEAKEAEMIPQKASDTEKAADGVKDLSKQEDKKADKSAIKQATSKLRQQLIMPTKLDQLQDKEFMANVDSTMNSVTDDLGVSVSAKTEEVGADYKEIDNPGLGEKPRSAKALPALEKAQETPLMDVGEMTALQKVPDEQLETIRKAGDDADKVLKKEKIGEGEAISFEQLSEASDEDLRRGVVGYNKVQEESGSGADEVKKAEKAKHDAMTKAIKEKEQAKRSHMRANRDEQLKASRGQQGRAKSEFEVKRAEITAQMDEVYKRARKAVTERLAKVDGEVKKRFARVKSKAMAAFTRNVESKLDKFHDDRYHYEGQGLGERIGNIWDSWFEDTSELPEVIAIFDNEKERFIAAIDAGITEIVAYVESEVAACKQIIANANTELENIVAKQSPAFKKIAKEAYTKMRKQLDKLDSEVDKKAAELKKYLAEQRKKAIEEVDKKIAEIKERLKGALHQLAKFLTDAAYKFFKGILAASGFSTEQIDKIINQGIEVLTKIVTDPLGFFQNVVEAVGQGFNNFVGNIGKHLKNGFFAWLTGAMAGVGLNLPQKWDLKGIFSVVLQVMGLNWDGIRARIAKEVGEDNLARAEEAGGAGLELLQQIKEKGFVEAVWDMLVEKAGEIQAMVITEIQNWLITSVVKQAIIKILSMLNPAGAIVQAILAIYDFAMWLINNWERIVQIIQNIVSSIGKIAMGQLGDAAKFIENTLATFVPMLLDFLARLLRLGNVSEKIKKILQRVRKPIDDLIAKVMAWIKKKIRGFKKKKKGDKGKEKDKKEGKDKDIKKDQIDKNKKDQAPPASIKIPFSMNGESHHVRAITQNKGVKIVMASKIERDIFSKIQGQVQTLEKIARSIKNSQADRDLANLVKGKILDLRTKFFDDVQVAHGKWQSGQFDKKTYKAQTEKFLRTLVKQIVKRADQYDLRDLAELKIHENFLKIELNIKELYKNVGSPTATGDGHSNSAAAAERFGWTYTGSSTSPYHYERAIRVRQDLEDHLDEIDSLSKTYGRHYLKYEVYKEGVLAMKDCGLAVDNPRKYLLNVPYRKGGKSQKDLWKAFFPGISKAQFMQMPIDPGNTSQNIISNIDPNKYGG